LKARRQTCLAARGSGENNQLLPLLMRLRVARSRGSISGRLTPSAEDRFLSFAARLARAASALRLSIASPTISTLPFCSIRAVQSPNQKNSKLARDLPPPRASALE